jgi:hypothetical protein
MTTRKPEETPIVDPRVDAAWRARSREEPPAALDAAILAAARHAVGAGPQPIARDDHSRSHRHWWPFAVAATIAAITVGLLQLVSRENLVSPAADQRVISDVPPASAPRAPEVPKTLPSLETPQDRDAAPSGAMEAPRAPNASAPASSASQRKAESGPRPQPPVPKRFPGTTTERDQTGAAPSQPSALPTEKRSMAAPAAQSEQPTATAKDAIEAAPSENLTAATGRARREAAGTVASPPAPAAPYAPPPPAAAPPPQSAPMPQAAPAPAASSAAAPSSSPIEERRLARSTLAGTPGRNAADASNEARAKKHASLPVAEWIALIRKLIAEGKTTEAAKELAAFRAVHADYEALLPSDLRHWRPPEK